MVSKNKTKVVFQDDFVGSKQHKPRKFADCLYGYLDSNYAKPNNEYIAEVERENKLSQEIMTKLADLYFSRSNDADWHNSFVSIMRTLKFGTNVPSPSGKWWSDLYHILLRYKNYAKLAKKNRHSTDLFYSYVARRIPLENLKRSFPSNNKFYDAGGAWEFLSELDRDLLRSQEDMWGCFVRLRINELKTKNSK